MIIPPALNSITAGLVSTRLLSVFRGKMFESLTSYNPSYIEQFRRAATYVDKFLKGAKPAKLTVEQATKFDFVINLKTAKQINLTIPPSVLYQADRVIK